MNGACQKLGSFWGTTSFKVFLDSEVLYLDDTTSPTQFPDFQLFNLQSVFVKSGNSQFTCKRSKIWTLLKIIGVNKFILLVILADHGERLTCFPFDRGKMDCYLFLFGLPCLQAIVICVKTGQSMFSQILSMDLIGEEMCMVL